MENSALIGVIAYSLAALVISSAPHRCLDSPTAFYFEVGLWFASLMSDEAKLMHEFLF
jgi:hypothetical protein